MFTKPLYLYFFLFLCITVPLSQASMQREWNTSQGKIKASLIEITPEGVCVLTSDGTSKLLKNETLSQIDRHYLKEGILEGNNFNDPWPTESKINLDFPIEIITEKPGKYTYGTPHFNFICDAKITKQVIKRFAQIFESTYEANRNLPLNNAPVSDKDEKFKIYLFEKRESFIQAGGLPDCDGCQIWGEEPSKYGYVIAPFESLGIKKNGKSFSINYRDDDITTLIHETTHMLMRMEVTDQPWFSEGAAQYVECTPYRNGRFNFKGNKRSIISSITADGLNGKTGRALTKNIKLPKLQDLMTINYDQFNTDQDIDMKYGAALLLTYYFYHGDGKGDASRIKKFIRALQTGASLEESHQILLDGRSWKQLSDEFVKFWGKSGIKISLNA